MSILMLDGQARTGKTSTAQLVRSGLIAQGFKVELEKFTKDERSRHHVLIGQILPLAVDDSTIHILDRGIYTELVYAKLHLRPYNQTILKLVDQLMGNLPVYVAVLQADRDTLIERHNNTARPFEGDIDLIAQMFRYEAVHSSIKNRFYDTSSNNPPSVATLIINDFLEVQKWQ